MHGYHVTEEPSELALTESNAFVRQRHNRPQHSNAVHPDSASDAVSVASSQEHLRQAAGPNSVPTASTNLSPLELNHSGEVPSTNLHPAKSSPALFIHNPYSFGTENSFGTETQPFFQSPKSNRSSDMGDDQHVQTVQVGQSSQSDQGNQSSALSLKTTSQKAPETKAICLDYLKGICEQKRWRCKYAHPPLNLTVPDSRVSSPSQEICEVWVLTGFCKFGEKCRNAHPPLEDCGFAKGLYAAPDTLKSRLVNNAQTPVTVPTRYRLDEDLRGVSAPPAVSAEQTQLASLSALLKQFVPDNFDKLAEELFHMLSTTASNGMFCKAIMLIFLRAVSEPHQSAIFARLCRRLWWWLPIQQRDAIPRQLMNLVAKMDNTPLEEGGQTSPEAIRKKRTGNAVFLGHLLQEKLIAETEVLEILNGMARRTKAPDGGEFCANSEEALLTIEVACKLLSLVGDSLDRRHSVQVDEVLSQMRQTASQTHVPRIQFLVANTAWQRNKTRQQQQQLSPAPAPAPSK